MTDDRQPASFLALGDSFTEGLNDTRPDGTDAGWADRFAALLDGAARRAGRDGIQYANLAVRGRLLDQVIADQVPVALVQRPELVAFSAGGNDLLRVHSDPDALARRYESSLQALRAAGSRVLVFTGFDVGTTPVLRLARGKIAIYNEHLRVIAARHDCDLVDLWSLDSLRDRRAFSGDRLHLSAEGHERVARLVARAVGVPAGDPEQPYSSDGVGTTRRDDLLWAREHLLPWVGRRVRHHSSGDEAQAKRPQLVALREPSA